MATFSSTQYASISTANAASKLEVKDLGGRVRIARFSVPATVGLAQNDIYNLTLLPKGASVIGGAIDFGAYGASVTLSIGYSGSTSKYLSALDISAAGQGLLANTVAKGLGDTITADQIIIATFAGANPDDTKVLEGYLLYIKD